MHSTADFPNFTSFENYQLFFQKTYFFKFRTYFRNLTISLAFCSKIENILYKNSALFRNRAIGKST